MRKVAETYSVIDCTGYEHISQPSGDTHLVFALGHVNARTTFVVRDVDSCEDIVT